MKFTIADVLPQEPQGPHVRVEVGAHSLPPGYPLVCDVLMDNLSIFHIYLGERLLKTVSSAR